MDLNSLQPERDLLRSQIKNEYANVVYSQTCQEEQRNSLTKLEKRIKVAQISLSALSTTGVLGIVFLQHTWVTAVTAVITFFSLVLNSYSLHFEIGEKAARHRKAGDQLWLLGQKYLSLLVDFNGLETVDIQKRRDALIKETYEIYGSIERTDDKSFQKAQKRLKNGLKKFSQEELNQLLPSELC